MDGKQHREKVRMEQINVAFLPCSWWQWRQQRGDNDNDAVGGGSGSYKVNDDSD